MSRHFYVWKVLPRLAGGVTALWLGLLAMPARGQVEFSKLPPPGAPIFDLDYAAFRGAGDSIQLAVYYKIDNPRLSFVRRTLKPAELAKMGVTPVSGDSSGREYYVAAYEITAVLSSDREKQVATTSARENYALPTFEETRDQDGYLVNVLTLSCEPGDYELAVTLSDRIASSQHQARLRLTFDLLKGRSWTLSTPLFIDPSAQAPDNPRFERRGRKFVPLVSHLLSGSGERLNVYFEAYTASASDAHHVVVELSQKLGRKRLVDTLSLAGSGAIVPMKYRSDLSGFKMGEGMLRLTLVDGKGRPVGEPQEAPFWVDWSMGSIIDVDWQEAVEMLVHIATHDELETLRATPLVGRASAFEQFWKSKDPTPGSEENEWRDEYYRRIRHADLHFATAYMAGWRTDFGRVYVRFGEPDEVERHPFDQDRKPYEIWFYYSQRRRFLFIDEKGSGDHELQYPYDGIQR